MSSSRFTNTSSHQDGAFYSNSSDATVTFPLGYVQGHASRNSAYLGYNHTYGAGHRTVQRYGRDHVSADYNPRGVSTSQSYPTTNWNGTSDLSDLPSQTLNRHAAIAGPLQAIDHDNFFRLVQPGVVTGALTTSRSNTSRSNVYGSNANSFAFTSIRQAPHGVSNRQPAVATAPYHQPSNFPPDAEHFLPNYNHGYLSTHVTHHLSQGPSTIHSTSFDDDTRSMHPVSYVCQWNEGGSICGRQVLGTRTQMNQHLHAFHGFFGRERLYARCLWDGCSERMQRGSIARHIVTCHLHSKVTCPLCSKELSRQDVLTKHLRVCELSRV